MRNSMGIVFLIGILLVGNFSTNIVRAQTSRWTEQKANDWYSQEPWLVGSNYIPRSAVNQLEMWQEPTFNPGQIDQELTWAEALGMNTIRVFLHDLLWQQDATGFQKRIDQFLKIAARHHLRPIFVLFDSCWDPLPHLGPQHPPIPGVHNSGWVQSPGAKALADPDQYPRLKAYVHGVVGAFAKDNRILAWDVWNEPGADSAGSYPKEDPANKTALVTALLPQAFEWAREANPIQPLTSGVWAVDTSIDGSDLGELQQIQLRESDIITFHNYNWPEVFKREVMWLKKYKRPIICTEYMARSIGSTFDTVLPIAKEERVGAINWGFVAGKTQTYLPWESWEHPYILSQPPVWFHEVLRPDGTPYRQAEADLIRKLTASNANARSTNSSPNHKP
jgi:Glycosyl hydrolase family 10